ncbi:MAG TPA: MarR family transcriptional regulator, partial [Nocardioides sp.]|nr:MarR family transcriptional regulator [Nocardioides sp.]
SGLSLADYEVLVNLTDVPEQTLRMYELGERMQWEKSRLSKQLTRMAARGLVARRECADDRRGAFVDLTPAGAEAIESAAPAHVELVRELVFDHLTPEQVDALAAVTAVIQERLSAPSASMSATASDA